MKLIWSGIVGLGVLALLTGSVVQSAYHNEQKMDAFITDDNLHSNSNGHDENSQNEDDNSGQENVIEQDRSEKKDSSSLKGKRNTTQTDSKGIVPELELIIDVGDQPLHLRRERDTSSAGLPFNKYAQRTLYKERLKRSMDDYTYIIHPEVEFDDLMDPGRVARSVDMDGMEFDDVWLYDDDQDEGLSEEEALLRDRRSDEGSDILIVYDDENGEAYSVREKRSPLRDDILSKEQYQSMIDSLTGKNIGDSALRKRRNEGESVEQSKVEKVDSGESQDAKNAADSPGNNPDNYKRGQRIIDLDEEDYDYHHEDEAEYHAEMEHGRLDADEKMKQQRKAKVRRGFDDDDIDTIFFGEDDDRHDHDDERDYDTRARRQGEGEEPEDDEEDEDNGEDEDADYSSGRLPEDEILSPTINEDNEGDDQETDDEDEQEDIMRRNVFFGADPSQQVMDVEDFQAGGRISNILGRQVRTVNNQPMASDSFKQKYKSEENIVGVLDALENRQTMEDASKRGKGKRNVQNQNHGEGELNSNDNNAQFIEGNSGLRRKGRTLTSDNAIRRGEPGINGRDGKLYQRDARKEAEDMSKHDYLDTEGDRLESDAGARVFEVSGDGMKMEEARENIGSFVIDDAAVARVDQADRAIRDSSVSGGVVGMQGLSDISRDGVGSLERIENSPLNGYEEDINGKRESGFLDLQPAAIRKNRYAFGVDLKDGLKDNPLARGINKIETGDGNSAEVAADSDRYERNVNNFHDGRIENQYANRHGRLARNIKDTRSDGRPARYLNTRVKRLDEGSRQRNTEFLNEDLELGEGLEDLDDEEVEDDATSLYQRNLGNNDARDRNAGFLYQRQLRNTADSDADEEASDGYYPYERSMRHADSDEDMDEEFQEPYGRNMRDIQGDDGGDGGYQDLNKRHFREIDDEDFDIDHIQEPYGRNMRDSDADDFVEDGGYQEPYGRNMRDIDSDGSQDNHLDLYGRNLRELDSYDLDQENYQEPYQRMLRRNSDSEELWENEDHDGRNMRDIQGHGIDVDDSYETNQRNVRNNGEEGGMSEEDYFNNQRRLRDVLDDDNLEEDSGRYFRDIDEDELADDIDYGEERKMRDSDNSYDDLDTRDRLGRSGIKSYYDLGEETADLNGRDLKDLNDEYNYMDDQETEGNTGEAMRKARNYDSSENSDGAGDTMDGSRNARMSDGVNFYKLKQGRYERDDKKTKKQAKKTLVYEDEYGKRYERNSEDARNNFDESYGQRFERNLGDSSNKKLDENYGERYDRDIDSYGSDEEDGLFERQGRNADGKKGLQRLREDDIDDGIDGYTGEERGLRGRREDSDNAAHHREGRAPAFINNNVDYIDEQMGLKRSIQGLVNRDRMGHDPIRQSRGSDQDDPYRQSRGIERILSNNAIGKKMKNIDEPSSEKMVVPDQFVNAMVNGRETIRQGRNSEGGIRNSYDDKATNQDQSIRNARNPMQKRHSISRGAQSADNNVRQLRNSVKKQFSSNAAPSGIVRSARNLMGKNIYDHSREASSGMRLQRNSGQDTDAEDTEYGGNMRQVRNSKDIYYNQKGLSSGNDARLQRTAGRSHDANSENSQPMELYRRSRSNVRQNVEEFSANNNAGSDEFQEKDLVKRHKEAPLLTDYIENTEELVNEKEGDGIDVNYEAEKDRILMKKREGDTEMIEMPESDLTEGNIADVNTDGKEFVAMEDVGNNEEHSLVQGQSSDYSAGMDMDHNIKEQDLQQKGFDYWIENKPDSGLVESYRGVQGINPLNKRESSVNSEGSWESEEKPIDKISDNGMDSTDMEQKDTRAVSDRDGTGFGSDGTEMEQKDTRAVSDRDGTGFGSDGTEMEQKDTRAVSDRDGTDVGSDGTEMEQKDTRGLTDRDAASDGLGSGDMGLKDSSLSEHEVAMEGVDSTDMGQKEPSHLSDTDEIRYGSDSTEMEEKNSRSLSDSSDAMGGMGNADVEQGQSDGLSGSSDASVDGVDNKDTELRKSRELNNDDIESLISKAVSDMKEMKDPEVTGRSQELEEGEHIFLEDPDRNLRDIHSEEASLNDGNDINRFVDSVDRYVNEPEIEVNEIPSLKNGYKGFYIVPEREFRDAKEDKVNDKKSLVEEEIEEDATDSKKSKKKKKLKSRNSEETMSSDDDGKKREFLNWAGEPIAIDEIEKSKSSVNERKKRLNSYRGTDNEPEISESDEEDNADEESVGVRSSRNIGNKDLFEELEKSDDMDLVESFDKDGNLLGVERSIRNAEDNTEDSDFRLGRDSEKKKKKKKKEIESEVKVKDDKRKLRNSDGQIEEMTENEDSEEIREERNSDKKKKKKKKVSEEEDVVDDKKVNGKRKQRYSDSQIGEDLSVIRNGRKSERKKKKKVAEAVEAESTEKVDKKKRKQRDYDDGIEDMTGSEDTDEVRQERSSESEASEVARKQRESAVNTIEENGVADTSDGREERDSDKKKKRKGKKQVSYEEDMMNDDEDGEMREMRDTDTKKKKKEKKEQIYEDSVFEGIGEDVEIREERNSDKNPDLTLGNSDVSDLVRESRDGVKKKKKKSKGTENSPEETRKVRHSERLVDIVDMDRREMGEDDSLLNRIVDDSAMGDMLEKRDGSSGGLQSEVESTLDKIVAEDAAENGNQAENVEMKEEVSDSGDGGSESLVSEDLSGGSMLSDTNEKGVAGGGMSPADVSKKEVPQGVVYIENLDSEDKKKMQNANRNVRDMDSAMQDGMEGGANDRVDIEKELDFKTDLGDEKALELGNDDSEGIQTILDLGADDSGGGVAQEIDLGTDGKDDVEQELDFGTKDVINGVVVGDQGSSILQELNEGEGTGVAEVDSVNREMRDVMNSGSLLNNKDKGVSIESLDAILGDEQAVDGTASK